MLPSPLTLGYPRSEMVMERDREKWFVKRLGLSLIAMLSVKLRERWNTTIFIGNKFNYQLPLSIAIFNYERVRMSESYCKPNAINHPYVCSFSMGIINYRPSPNGSCLWNWASQNTKIAISINSSFVTESFFHIEW